MTKNNLLIFQTYARKLH